MIKKLVFIYLALLSPLLCFNMIKVRQLQSLKKENRDLQLLSLKVKTFTKVEKKNQKTLKKYSSINPEYLFTHLEQLPLTQNKIQLIESPPQATAFYTERGESLAQPVEVDLAEIKTVLERIEGLSFDQKPHLFFTDFSLKKNSDPDNMTYLLNFKMKKREYHL